MQNGNYQLLNHLICAYSEANLDQLKCKTKQDTSVVVLTY